MFSVSININYLFITSLSQALLLSALAASSLTLAAPTEVVAGRVITHTSAPAPVLLHHSSPVAVHQSLHQADLRARFRAALRANRLTL